MPSSNGVYTLPPGYLAVDGATILPSNHNPPLEDIAAALTARLPRDGSAPMTGPLKMTDGVLGAPSLAFATAASTGIRKTANGIGFDVAGAFVAEIGSSGFSLADKAIALRNLYHPSGPSLLLGTDSNAALTITGAASSGVSNLIRLSVASTTTFATGQKKTVSDVTGTTEANGTWTITVIDSTHIDLQGSAFVNNYVSGGTIGGGVEEITIGSGLSLGGSVLTAAFAPPAAFKNLSIKVLTNTTVAVAADFVVTTDGSTFKTTALSATIDLGTTGINALDQGTIAQATWYAIHAVVKPDGTTGAVASTSATSPVLPSGYTLKSRIGWVRTAAATAQLLGTWQFGRRVQYIVGLAQTSILPNIAIGTTVATWTAVSVSSFVPTTASELIAAIFGDTQSNGFALVAPNNSYPTVANAHGIPYATFNGNASGVVVASVVSLILESTNIYWGVSAVSAAIDALGWVDNI